VFFVVAQKDCTEPVALRNVGVSIDDCNTLDKLPVNQFDETHEDAEPEIDSIHKSEVTKSREEIKLKNKTLLCLCLIFEDQKMGKRPGRHIRRMRSESPYGRMQQTLERLSEP
jgi:hypothetical protein